MGPVGNDFSGLNPFNKAEHYHTCDGCPSGCNIDFNNGNQWQVENCRLAGLPDLSQENPFVTQTLVSWAKSIVSTYQLDGLRIDTVPEVPKPFWKTFQQSLGNLYTLGEVFDGRVDYLAPYQDALTSLLSYPMYFTLRDVFGSRQSMHRITGRESEYLKMRDPSILGTFVDNHDNARFLSSQGDIWLYKNALTYALTAKGTQSFIMVPSNLFVEGTIPSIERLSGVQDTTQILKCTST